MASALQLIGEEEADESSIARLLEADAIRPLQPAPAEGLILWDTDCGIVWTPVMTEGQSGAFIDHLVRHHALMEKVCKTASLFAGIPETEPPDGQTGVESGLDWGVGDDVSS